MNDNVKNNILVSENIRQKELTVLEYFDVYNYHHHHYQYVYHSRVYNDDKYMHRNIPELLVFFV